MRPVVAALLPALPLILGGCQVATDPYGRKVVSTPTLGQVLGLAPQHAVQPGQPRTVQMAEGTAQDQRVIAGHTVRITAVGNGHQVVVDGRVLATDTEDDRVAIQDVYQGSGRTYVLIAEQSGGTACPSLYQAIDLSGPLPAISPQIGNCSDIPRVSVVSGTLRVTAPAFRAAPAATFAFRDGRLSR